MTISKDQQNIFTDEQIENFAGLFDILERVHRRLIMEGNIIKDNEIIPPPDETLTNN